MFLNLFLALIFQFGGGACGCEDKPQVNTLAVVNGIKITKQQLGSEAQNRITQLEAEVIKARNAAVDLQINSILLEAEAKKRGLTAEQLLQLEVFDKVPKPSDAEAQIFYDERKQQIGKDFKSVRADIISFLKTEGERAEAVRFAGALRSAAKITVVNPNVTPPTNLEELDRVFVTVNDRPITSREIEESLLPLIFITQEQVYEVRKEDLDQRINELLLESEAKAKNTTPTALLTNEVRSKLPIITDQEARIFYEANKAKINRDFDQVKFTIIDYLLTAEQKKLSAAYAAKLRENAAVQIYLTPPESPTFRVAIDNQPTRGNEKATVTVVEFTDFQCQACAMEYPEFERLVAEFGSQVKFVVRDFPLSNHPFAAKAAEAAEAAREQGKYWEYISLLYARQSALGVDDLKKYASQLGMDRAKFDVGLDSGIYRGHVERDTRDADKLGLKSTPAFFVNGRRVVDYSYEGLRSAISSALKRSN
jgi:protein-disulfide isomerase